MNLSDFGILADENIHPVVITFLRNRGINVSTVWESGLNGKADIELLRFAKEHHQVVLTHDADFGKIIYTLQADFIGIIYLRPGHIKPEFSIRTLETIFSQPLSLKTPFVVTGEHAPDEIRIRVRQF
ncbi:MAG: DUF5615 family PIN-like protein [Bacteroidia bacterium]|nr:DUF5615 family PIN-like protein [Bacteroidia bacterium]